MSESNTPPAAAKIAAPTDPAARLDAIREAIGKLDPNGEDTFSLKGFPLVPALERVLGWAPTSEERHRAWDELQAQARLPEPAAAPAAVKISHVVRVHIPGLRQENASNLGEAIRNRYPGSNMTNGVVRVSTADPEQTEKELIALLAQRGFAKPEQYVRVRKL